MTRHYLLIQQSLRPLVLRYQALLIQGVPLRSQGAALQNWERHSLAPLTQHGLIQLLHYPGLLIRDDLHLNPVLSQESTRDRVALAVQ